MVTAPVPAATLELTSQQKPQGTKKKCSVEIRCGLSCLVCHAYSNWITHAISHKDLYINAATLAGLRHGECVDMAHRRPPNANADFYNRRRLFDHDFLFWKWKYDYCRFLIRDSRSSDVAFIRVSEIFRTASRMGKNRLRLLLTWFARDCWCRIYDQHFPYALIWPLATDWPWY